MSTHYQQRDFLTQSEVDFLRALEACLDPAFYYICPQVALNRLLEPITTDDYDNFEKLGSKSIDFVICDRTFMRARLAIELNDTTHLEPKRELRDQQIREFCLTARLPLLIYWRQPSYDLKLLCHRLGEQMGFVSLGR